MSRVITIVISRFIWNKLIYVVSAKNFIEKLFTNTAISPFTFTIGYLQQQNLVLQYNGAPGTHTKYKDRITKMVVTIVYAIRDHKV